MSKLTNEDDFNLGHLLLSATNDRNKVAFKFLEKGKESSISYGELNEQVRLVSLELKKFTQAGSRALLVFPPGIDYIVGFLSCLFCGVIAVPVYPPTSPSSALALRKISDDCKPSVILSNSGTLRALSMLNSTTTVANLPIAGGLVTSVLGVSSDMLNGMNSALDPKIKRLAVDIASKSKADPTSLQPAVRKRNDVAFLQYTSGSTGDPKGVMVSQGNLLHNMEQYSSIYNVSESVRLVSWLPPYHDMGLIGFILGPLYYAYETLLFSPVDFLRDPLLWIEAMARHGAHVSGGPNFAYGLVTKRYDPKRLKGIDLSCVTALVIGAEPIRPQTMNEFLAAYRPYGLKDSSLTPAYGLAEGTLGISVRNHLHSDPFLTLNISKAAYAEKRVELLESGVSDADAMKIVGCGTVCQEHEVVIVDTELRTILAEAQVGEIWIRSKSVAQGYWEKTELTATAFQATTADGRGPYLRTGDLGFLYQRQVFISGRLKDVIIIAGRNFHPADIEAAIEQAHEEVRPGCSLALEVPAQDTEELVLLVELRRGISSSTQLEEIATAIAHKVLLNCSIPPSKVILLPPKALNKTTSGKVRRQPNKLQYLEGNFDRKLLFVKYGVGKGEPAKKEVQLTEAELGEVSEMESEVRALWAEVLNIDADAISRTNTFMDLGGQSLLVALLQHRAAEEIGVDIPLDWIFTRSLAAMAKGLESLKAHRPEDAVKEVRDPAITPLCAEPGLPPMFLVHTGVGIATLYRHILAPFQQQFNVYGVNYPNIAVGDWVDFESIEQMATDYIRRIRTVAPKGPYHLGGRSAGGIIAMEMARQLIEEGEAVGSVLLLDPTYHLYCEDWDLTFFTMMAGHMNNFDELLPRVAKCFHVLYRLLDRYKPVPVPLDAIGRLMLIKCRGSAIFRGQQRAGGLDWRFYDSFNGLTQLMARGQRIYYEDMACNHFEMTHTHLLDLLNRLITSAMTKKAYFKSRDDAWNVAVAQKMGLKYIESGFMMELPGRVPALSAADQEALAAIPVEKNGAAEESEHLQLTTGNAFRAAKFRNPVKLIKAIAGRVSKLFRPLLYEELLVCTPIALHDFILLAGRAGVVVALAGNVPLLGAWLLDDIVYQSMVQIARTVASPVVNTMNLGLARGSYKEAGRAVTVAMTATLFAGVGLIGYPFLIAPVGAMFGVDGEMLREWRDYALLHYACALPTLLEVALEYFHMLIFSPLPAVLGTIVESALIVGLLLQGPHASNGTELGYVMLAGAGAKLLVNVLLSSARIAKFGVFTASPPKKKILMHWKSTLPQVTAQAIEHGSTLLFALLLGAKPEDIATIACLRVLTEVAGVVPGALARSACVFNRRFVFCNQYLNACAAVVLGMLLSLLLGGVSVAVLVTARADMWLLGRVVDVKVLGVAFAMALLASWIGPLREAVLQGFALPALRSAAIVSFAVFANSSMLVLVYVLKRRSLLDLMVALACGQVVHALLLSKEWLCFSQFQFDNTAGKVAASAHNSKK